MAVVLAAAAARRPRLISCSTPRARTRPRPRAARRRDTRRAPGWRRSPGCPPAGPGRRAGLRWPCPCRQPAAGLRRGRRGLRGTDLTAALHRGIPVPGRRVGRAGRADASHGRPGAVRPAPADRLRRRDPIVHPGPGCVGRGGRGLRRPSLAVRRGRPGPDRVHEPGPARGPGYRAAAALHLPGCRGGRCAQLRQYWCAAGRHAPHHRPGSAPGLDVRGADPQLAAGQARPFVPPTSWCRTFPTRPCS